jgi:photosystem II stability/assembly factor-like uncharacterized protein
MIHKLAFIASILAFMLTTSPRADAQWVSTNGPPGDVLALTFSGTTLFAGTSEGVFFLNDGDTSWTATSFSSTHVQALVEFNGNLVAGTTIGVFISPDNGNNWPQSDDSQSVFAFASIGSNLFAGTQNGIFISNNNGGNWTATNYQYQAYSLIAVGTNLFAGDYDGGVSFSPDNGNTWTEVDSGLPNTRVSALVANGNDIFAGATLFGGGIFLTTNNGAIWTQCHTGLPDTTIVNSFFVSGSYLFAGTDSDIFLSTDNGGSWRDVSAGLDDSIYASSIAVYSFTSDGNNLFAGTQRGVWMSPLPLFAGVETNALATTLLTNYPNPFADKTTINLSSHESGVAEISVVNILGTEVARIFDGELDAGEHSFTWDGGTMPPGMYECIVRMNGNVQRIPLAHLK